MLSFIAAALAFSAPAVAQTSAVFKGETINISVGYPAGGAPDLYFRVLARHYGRHIPGNPLIIVKNMPGAGTLRAANYIYNVAAKDGTELGNFSSSATMEPLMDNDQANTQRRIPADATVDLKLSGAYEHFFWSLSVNNLFNALYYDYAIASTFTPGRFSAYPLPGRTYMVKAGATF